MNKRFSSLFREFISLISKTHLKIQNSGEKVFVPFQGIHFFNIADRTGISESKLSVFVPFQGIHFFNRRRASRI